MLEVNEKLSIPLKEFNFSFARSSGPGGQNVNKVNTKATLRWKIFKSKSIPEDVRNRFSEKYARRINLDREVVVVSQRFRDQGRNVADCLNKLKAMIQSVLTPPKVRKKRKVSKQAKQRRLDQKKRNSQRKQNRQTPKFD